MIIKHKTVIALAFCVLFAFFAMSCGNSHPDPKVESLQITPANPRIPMGPPQQITVTAVYDDGTTGDVTSKVTWSSSDETVATVSAAGLVSPIAGGTAEITAMYGFNVLTFTVSIVPAALVSISVDPVNPSIANAMTQQFTATGLYTDSSTGSISAIWNSSDETVATIGIATGLAQAVGIGNTTIIATFGTVSGSTLLTVTPAPLVSISITPVIANVPKGLDQQFTATGTFADFSTQDLTTQVTWGSNTPAVATIDANGLASSLSVGTSVINATDPGSGISSTASGGDATFTVTDAKLVSIAVTPAFANVPKGLTQQFTATGTYTDSSSLDITTQVTWNSTDPAVADVSNAGGSEGLATGLSVGPTTISAKDPVTGITSTTSGGDAELTVSIEALVSIAVTPAFANVISNLPSRSTQQFTATGTYTDTSTKDITTFVTWYSSDTGIANISNGAGSEGLATGLTASPPNATIDAVDPATGIAATDSGGEATLTVKTVVISAVQPLYPTNGAAWNDYVVNDGADTFTASDTSCDPLIDTDCLHGGELRAVVTTKAGCTGLAASDSLGAFDWTCDESTNPVRIISTGLKDGMNLSDLLDFTTKDWKPNSVTVLDGGSDYLATSPSIWWTNPVIEDNNGNDGTLMNPGEIYMVTLNATNIYTIGADKVALVVKPGVTLTGSAGADENIIYALGPNFLWLEGTIDASGDKYGIYLDSVDFSVLRHIDASNASSALAVGVSLIGSSYNTLAEVTSSNNTSTGIYLGSSSDNNRLENISGNNNSYGVVIVMSSGNMVTGAAAFNNVFHGVYLNTSSDNTLSDVTTANNEQNGVYLDSTTSNTFTNITSSNNKSFAIYVKNSSYNSFMNLAVSNAFKGILLNNTSYTNLSNLAASNNDGIGIELLDSSENHFEGLLEVGGNAQNCFVSGTYTNPGIDGNCNPSNPSVTLVNGISLASSFTDKVLSDDTVNTSDIIGSSLYSNITDWNGFENFYRGWGLEGSAFPATNNQGRCGSGTCRIWDWSLVTGDTVIKDVLPLHNSGDSDDALVHTWSAGTTTFLRNAVEIAGDGVGNDNTLCESDETCLYTPNIGSYQGHGSLVSVSPPFTDGLVLTGITLLEYSTNGR